MVVKSALMLMSLGLLRRGMRARGCAVCMLLALLLSTMLTAGCGGGGSGNVGGGVCAESGQNLPNGTSCGTNQVCNGGTCVACTQGAGCTPAANACHIGSISCSSGPVCTDTGANVPNGTSCGVNQVCNAGKCVAVVSVTIDPTSATVQAGSTQQFTATVTGSSNTAVTWSVQEGSAGGSMSASGLYTAPGTPGTYHVVATSQADTNKSATATVTVSPVPIASVTVAPATATIQVGQTVQLTATAKDAKGNVLPGRAVTWASSNPALATVSASGLVTGIAAGGPVTITATSEGQSGTASVTVTPPIAVSVSPTSVSVQVGTTQQLTAIVANDSAQRGVTWTLTVGATTCSPACGTISPTSTGSGAPATYLAPATVPINPMVTVTSFSATAPSKSASATIRVTAPPGDSYVTSFGIGPNGNTSGGVRFDGAGNVLGFFALPLPFLGLLDPKGLAFGPDGNLYVAAVSVLLANIVMRFDNVGNFIDCFIPRVQDCRALRPDLNSIALGTFHDLTFGPDRNLYVGSDNGLFRFDGITGRPLDTPLGLPVPVVSVRGGYAFITFGPDKNLYMATFEGISGPFIQRLDMATLRASTFIAKFTNIPLPSGIRFGPDGNHLYVINNQDIPAPGGGAVTVGQVDRYDLTGRFFDTFVPRITIQQPGGAPVAVAGSNLAFGNDGNLYVLDFSGNNHVVRYDGMSGNPRLFSTVPFEVGSGPVYIAFQPRSGSSR